jgi:hypothetical protein
MTFFRLDDVASQEDPNHAQALVWRGAARSFQAGQAFRAGDIARGRELSASGMSDMDRAVSIEPKSIGVLIPRASTLLAAARFQPDPARARDLAAQRGRRDIRRDCAGRACQKHLVELRARFRNRQRRGELGNSRRQGRGRALSATHSRRASKLTLRGAGSREARQLERPRSAQLPELPLAMEVA